MKRLAAVCLVAGLVPAPAGAADEPPQLSEGWRFDQRGGAALYRAICQGCHMADGRGAEGAGRYPALAANPRLVAPNYVVAIVLQGRRAMPAFDEVLDDDQVAAVVGYVCTQLGGQPAGRVSAADVKSFRRGSR